ncbi:MAG: rhomboid family intramembrane serine protease [Usitatibacter sp.]
MLIVPIVEGLDWRRPPPVTVALILLNCLVFFLYQTGDASREAKALEAYAASSLPRLELPAFKERLRQTEPKLAPAIEKAGPAALVGRMESDQVFMRELRAGRIVTPQNPSYAQWKEDRARFDALAQKISFRRFGFIPADARPVTWIASMFLHGDLMHLLGNMVFLFIVGVAVESALGGFWYLLLYLAGGLAGDAMLYAVNPSSLLPTVGASGAISGLMGLFTVVFGLRKVNFFYWVIVFFGFRQMRGLVVLPIWIGWEIVQYATDKGSHVAYMAHAGGLMGGALLGLVVMKRFAGARVEQFHEEREQEAFDKAEYERARALVAKLDFKAASTVFARLAQRFPQEEALLRQWHAIAKSDTGSEAYHRSAGGILGLVKGDAALRAFQRQVFNEYLANARPAPRLEAQVLGSIGLQFARAGALAEAERAADMLFKQAPGEARLAVLWEALAHALDKSPGEESTAKAKRYRALIGARSRAARSMRPA